MNSPAGLVALAVMVIWLAYFVPSKLRHRQQITAARTEDRFSPRLRVLAISGGESLERAPGADCATGGQRAERLLTPPNGITARRNQPKGVHDVERSGISAARREHHARREAAARRRALVTVVLATVTAVTVLIGAVTPVPMLIALVPGLLLGSVLVLGRRAALADARAVAELHHRERIAVRAQESARLNAQRSGSRLVGRPAPVAKPRVTGRAVQASHALTVAIVPVASVSAKGPAAPAQVPVRQAPVREAPVHEAPARTERSASVEREWTEVAVPRPAYAMKPAAPRWEPAPLSAEIERVGRRLERWDAEDGVVSQSDALARELDVALTPIEGEADAAAVVADAPGTVTGVLGGGLDGILERRRAAGE